MFLIISTALLTLLLALAVPRRAAAQERLPEGASAFMAAAAQEAERNLTTKEGGPFGAVIVKDGQIIGRGRNRVLARHDPTAHAEIEAIRAACRTLGTHDLSGCTLYTSCYPCPMCLSAIVWANIRTVYYGNTAQDAAAIGFRDEDIYRFIRGGCTDSRFLSLTPMDRSRTLPAFQAWASQEQKPRY
jgi:guanine deaminase